MRALRLYPQGLVLEEIARPEPGPGEVLVRVHAAAITRDELTWPVDRLPAIPSYELAGVVEASGEAVMALTPFDRDGVAADYAVVPETLLAPRPAGLSDEQAAALPMPAISADQAGRVVTIAAEAPGAEFFVVEPNGAQLASLPELRPEVDSVFPLEDFRAAFERCAARGKHGKVVLRVAA